MTYRTGRKQKRAILDSSSKEVALFSKGQEELAERVCKLLNTKPETINMEKFYELERQREFS